MQRDVYFLCFKFSLLVVFVVSLFCFGVRISVSPRLALNTRSSLEACFTTPSFPFTYLKKFSSQAIKIMRAVEIAQQLKTHTVAEGPSLVLSTHIQQLRTICNSSSRTRPPGGHLNIRICRYKHLHVARQGAAHLGGRGR